MTAFFVLASSRISAWRSLKSAWPGNSATDAMLESTPFLQFHVSTPPGPFRSRIIGAVMSAARFTAAQGAFHDEARGLHEVFFLRGANRQAGFDVTETLARVT